MENVVSKSRFKPQALKYFRQVQEGGQELIITEYSKPVLKIVPYRRQSADILKELEGTVKRFDNPCEPVADDEWDVLK